MGPSILLPSLGVCLISFVCGDILRNPRPWSQQQIEDFTNKEMRGIDVDGTWDVRQLYLRLLRDTVAGIALGERELSLVEEEEGWLTRRRLDLALRRAGKDWPWLGTANTGLDNLNRLITAVIATHYAQVHGDIVDAGVWRGGTSALLFGSLLAYNNTDKGVFVLDRFHPRTSFSLSHQIAKLFYPSRSQALSSLDTESLEAVRANFYWQNLLDDKRLTFVGGPYQSILPSISGTDIAILRVDGRDRDTTRLILDKLYGQVTKGGWVFVDGLHKAEVREALTEFRRANDIGESMEVVNERCSYWIVLEPKATLRQKHGKTKAMGGLTSVPLPLYQHIYVFFGFALAVYLSAGIVKLLF